MQPDRSGRKEQILQTLELVLKRPLAQKNAKKSWKIFSQMEVRETFSLTA